MRISDWSSDVCSSDLERREGRCRAPAFPRSGRAIQNSVRAVSQAARGDGARGCGAEARRRCRGRWCLFWRLCKADQSQGTPSRSSPSRQSRSEEHTSELQSLMRISYAVFCLKKKKNAKPECTKNIRNK